MTWASRKDRAEFKSQFRRLINIYRTHISFLQRGMTTLD